MTALWRVWRELWVRVCRITLAQRGNRRLATFLSEADYMAYLELMVNLLRGHERTRRPLGSAAFVKRIESRRDRLLH